MSENLYFIPIIARALQEPDIGKALWKIFRKIKRMGAEEQYAEGFKNFKLFMEEVYNRYQITATDHVCELIAQLATGMFEDPVQEKEPLLDIIRSHPEWKTEYEAFCQMEADENRMREFPIIEVSNEKGRVVRKTFKKVPSRESFKEILPGRYKIKLVNTGWIIWEGKLTADQLIKTTLYAAADTKGTRRNRSNRIDLLDNGEVILRTYTGNESGRIEIELAR